MYCTQEPTCRAWWRQHVLYTRTYLQSMVAATCIVHKNLPAEHGGGNMYCTQEPTCRAWWRQHVLYTRTYLQSMVEATCIVHKNLPAEHGGGNMYCTQEPTCFCSDWIFMASTVFTVCTDSVSCRTLVCSCPQSSAQHTDHRVLLLSALILPQ